MTLDDPPRSWKDQVGPWQTSDAQRATLVLIAVMSALILINACTHHQPSTVARIISFVLPAFMVARGLSLAKYGLSQSGPAYAVLPVLGCSVLAVIDVLDRDATAAAQIFFVLMSLYAGSQLRPIGAGFVTGAVIAYDGVVVFLVLPFSEALRDWLCTVIIFSTITFLLVRGSSAQYRLTNLLNHQAAVDSLTGLVTRRILEDAAATSIARSQNHDGTALILLDVDNFKQINDTYGHPTGDAVLTHIAKLLLENTRPDSVISRLGGDELAILMPDCSYEVALARAAELVVLIHASPLLVDNPEREIVVSVSAGAAHAPTHGGGLVEVYAFADAGLYQAKHHGRNQVWQPHAPFLVAPEKPPA